MAISQQKPIAEEEYTFPAPNLNEVTPDYGKAGDTITIRGGHLASVAKCTITVGHDSETAEIVHHSDDNGLKVRVPRRLPTGNGQIRVSNDGGESNALSFTVQS
ncbi:IPT/TIG domain-containing protein [Glycomyces tarimensis]